jgi:glycosyltransferase involved in cell wall biosynthesis
METIIVSAINIKNGGPLTILKSCLSYLSHNLSSKYKIIVLVYDKRLLERLEHVEFIEFKKTTKLYLHKLYYEYYYFKKISIKFKPYLWLSLNDVTPSVKATLRVVYCHNPSPFYKCSFKEIMLDPKFYFFTLLYKFIYKINIKKNSFIVVQQDWIRKKFSSMFKIDENKIIVSPPSIDNQFKYFDIIKNVQDEKIFFYPAFPRVFKNFEIIGEAANILLSKSIVNFKIYLTINGFENNYAKYFFRKYKSIKNLSFIGLQSIEKIYEYYLLSDYLIFPSKLETWGLPISEMKTFEKPIIVADLPYAHETVGDYDKVLFFDPLNPKDLAETMIKAMSGKFNSNSLKPVNMPFAKGWNDLFNILLTHSKN